MPRADPAPPQRPLLRLRRGSGEAGFRPCARCRPELAPQVPWLGTSATVSRALRLAADDGREGGTPIPELAARLGIGDRHLRRLFLDHLGATPRAIALTRRAHFARRLLDETDLPMAHVAFGAGFGSIRRFNDVMRRTFKTSPRRLRRDRHRSGSARLALRLPYKPPFAWPELLAYLAARAIPGVESVTTEEYRRTITIESWTGAISARHVPADRAITLEIHAPAGAPPRNLLQIAERARRIFDLAADPLVISSHLKRDPRLARELRARPGMRVPGAWDGFEVAVRIILGQQVSVTGATTLAGRLARKLGTPVAGLEALGLDLLFPDAARLATSDLRSIGIPAARAATLRAIATAVASGRLDLGASADPAACLATARAIPGIGPWTAQMIAMRALSEPDAFPASDLGIRKALAKNGKLAPPAEVDRISRPWSPWRSYAAMVLWTSRTGGGQAPALQAPSRTGGGQAPALQAPSRTGGGQAPALQAPSRTGGGQAPALQAPSRTGGDKPRPTNPSRSR
ncbi:MAG: AlkA N-terminal domain-containing protein [Acidobacteriota bacterium]